MGIGVGQFGGEGRDGIYINLVVWCIAIPVVWPGNWRVCNKCVVLSECIPSPVGLRTLGETVCCYRREGNLLSSEWLRIFMHQLAPQNTLSCWAEWCFKRLAFIWGVMKWAMFRELPVLLALCWTTWSYANHLSLAGSLDVGGLLSLCLCLASGETPVAINSLHNSLLTRHVQMEFRRVSCLTAHNALLIREAKNKWPFFQRLKVHYIPDGWLISISL